MLLKRLEGSDVIPPLAKGVVEEDVDSKTWIVQKTLAKRVGVYESKEAFYAVDRSTERIEERKAIVV